MGFETPGTNNEALNTNENLTQFENRIKEIKEIFTNEGYSEEIGVEFAELWKNMPAGVSDETHENIDEINRLSMDANPDKE